MVDEGSEAGAKYKQDTGKEGRRIKNKGENRDYNLKSTQLWSSGSEPGSQPACIQGRLLELYSLIVRRKKTYQLLKSTPTTIKSHYMPEILY